MTNYKVNGKKVKLPDGWHDVSFNDGMRIIEEEMNNVEIFSLLSGISIKEIREMKGYEDVYYFMEGFPFLKKLPDMQELPMSVTIDGKFVHIPFADNDDLFDFGDCSVGQIEDMKQIIRSKTKEWIDGEERELTPVENINLMPYIVSIYLNGLTGEYDYKESVGVYTKKIKEQISLKYMISMGGFFLIRLANSKSGQTPLSKTFRKTRKILKLALRKLIKALGFTQR